MKLLYDRINANPSRSKIESLLTEFALAIPAGSRVLDAGAGDSPYAHLFKHFDYVTCDFGMVENKPYSRIHIRSDLAAIPVPDNAFDFIIFTQVLEHVPNPLKVFQELHRVLRPGGQIFCTAPFVYEEHEIPYDYYRFTRYGLRYLMEESGLLVISLEPLESSLSNLSYHLKFSIKQLALLKTKKGFSIKQLIFRFFFAMLVKPFFYAFIIILNRIELSSNFVLPFDYPRNWCSIASKHLPSI